METFHLLIKPRAQLTTSQYFQDADSDHWFNYSSLDMYTDQPDNPDVYIRSNTIAVVIRYDKHVESGLSTLHP